MLAACGGGASTSSETIGDGALSPLHAVRGAGAGIFDAQNRQMILRGVNYGALGDYYLDNPANPAPVLARPDDFAEMASIGINSIRLLVHWSKLEPQPGFIDASYVAQIRGQIEKAAQSGIYVIVDMHQDAWGKFVATREAGESCLPPLQPSLGWDGAPAWATLTDGLSTCHLQQREVSPAVSQAFTNFYLDTSGIRTHFIQAWAALAAAVADEPNVAGYDLLNEPNPGYLVGANGATALALLYADLISAIRSAEAPTGASHIVFFEPSIEWSLLGYTPTPLPSFTNDANIVFAPHNYCGSIGLVTSQDFCFQSSEQVASSYGVTFWSGEWGCFDSPENCLDHVVGFGSHEDATLTGSAMWQWAQACGDPHSVGSPGGAPGDQIIQVKILGCPGDVDLGFDATDALVLSRPYPRAAPGHLTSISSDAQTAAFEVRGSTDEAGELDVWAPERIGTPAIEGDSLSDLRVDRVAGGYRIRAIVTGDYRLRF